MSGSLLRLCTIVLPAFGGTLVLKASVSKVRGLKAAPGLHRLRCSGKFSQYSYGRSILTDAVFLGILGGLLPTPEKSTLGIERSP